MEQLIKNVTRYIDYLINDLKLCVSIHFLKDFYEKINGKVMMAIVPYIIHRNPYCLFVNEDHHDECIENQRKMIRSMTDTSPFENTCHAGAKELVHPIFKDGIAVGYVSVSGYRDRTTPFSILNPALWESALCQSDIPRSLTDTLIPPLVVMVGRLLEFAPDGDGEINVIMRLIADDPKSVTLSGVAKRIGRSPSYVSHLFKKKTGKSIRAYSNDLKLIEAQRLLSTSPLSVTEIAFELGFDDTSYFVRLFKEKYGETPYKYKKRNLTTKS